MPPVVRAATRGIGPRWGAGLTTRVGYPSGGEEGDRARLRDALSDSLGHPPLAWLKQVHGNAVHVVDSPGLAGDGDALVTARPDLVLLVTVADCCPVLFWDERRGIHGAAHAGWRGLVAGILPATVQGLADAGAPPPDLRAWIGPAIGPCCFEVGPEVAARFPERFRHPRDPRPHVDLPGAALAQLAELGLDPGRVEVAGDCTHCRDERYHSFRRDGGICGRHLGYVGRLA